LPRRRVICFTLGLYTRAYSIAPAAAIAPIIYLALVLGGYGWLVWSKVSGQWLVSGGILVITGGLLTLFLARKKQQS